jgi:Ca2+-binding RTX toxin-like protein
MTLSRILASAAFLAALALAPVAAQAVPDYTATVTVNVAQNTGAPVGYVVCFDSSQNGFVVSKCHAGNAPAELCYPDGTVVTVLPAPSSSGPKTEVVIEFVIGEEVNANGAGDFVTIDASALTRNHCLNTFVPRIVVRGEAGDGDNTFKGGDADDILIGGEGADSLYGRRGVDVIFGGKSGDLILGGGNSDVLNGDEGDDEIFGGWGRDTIEGGEGLNDLLHGDGGADDISDEDGAKVITGGAGDDDINVRLDASIDTFPWPTDGIVEGGGGSDRIWLTTLNPNFVLGSEIYEDVHTSQQPILAGNIQADPLAPVASLIKVTYGKNATGSYWASADGDTQIMGVTGHRFYVNMVAKLAPYEQRFVRALPYFNPQPVAFGPADAWTYYPEEANRSARIRLTNNADHLAVGSFKEGGGQLGAGTPFNPNSSNPGFRQAVFFPANNYCVPNTGLLSDIRSASALKLEVDLDGDQVISAGDESDWFKWFDDFVKDQVNLGADLSSFSGMVPLSGNMSQVQVPMLNGVPLITWTGGSSHILHDVVGTDFTALGLTLDVHLLYGYTPVIQARRGDDVVDARFVDDLRTNNPGSPYNPGSENSAGEVGERLGLKIHGGKGSDLLMGSRNNDRIYGHRDRDQIFGNRGDDVLHGGCADDLVLGGPGFDRLNGGRGFYDFLVGDHWDLSGPFDARNGARGTGNNLFNANGVLQATPDFTDRISDGDGVFAIFADSDTGNDGFGIAGNGWLHLGNAEMGADQNTIVNGSGAKDHVWVRFHREWTNTQGFRTFGGFSAADPELEGFPMQQALIQLGGGTDRLVLRAPRTCPNAPLPESLFVPAGSLTGDAIYGTSVSSGDNDVLVVRFRNWGSSTPYLFDAAEQATDFGFERKRGTVTYAPAN